MNITATGLTKAAGAAAAVAGAIFVAVQINHPATGTFTSATTQWVARSLAKIVMAALALAGITGLYLRQYRKAGLLGLIGYLVFAAGYLALFSIEVIAAAVLPNLVDSEPGFVNDVVAAANGRTPHGNIGGLQTLLNVGGAGYILGGLIFGIALFRTRVLTRWAAALLAVSTVATAALAVLPESFNRPLAVPEGIALIALGVSLWRNPRDTHQTSPDTSSETAPAVSPVAQLAVR
jgi:peptidyl-tRNA hydrolase